MMLSSQREMPQSTVHSTKERGPKEGDQRKRDQREGEGRALCVCNTGACTGMLPCVGRHINSMCVAAMLST